MPNLKKAIEYQTAFNEYWGDENKDDKNLLSCLKAYERDRERLNYFLKNHEWTRKDCDSAVKERKGK